nr:hypothetical protein [Tanacetum cinerariifolium]
MNLEGEVPLFGVTLIVHGDWRPLASYITKFLGIFCRGISILLAVGTPSTGSRKLYCQWELSSSSGNALCILFPTIISTERTSIYFLREVPLFGVTLIVHDDWRPLVDGKGAWDAKLDLADSANYVTKKVLDSIGFVHVSISDYCRKMVNDVNVEIHGVMYKADFVVLDYANEGEPSIMFGRDFLATLKSQVDFELGEIRMSLNMFEEVNGVVDLLEEVGSSSEEVVRWGRQNATKGTLCIDDGVIRHTYFPKPRSKSYVETFKMEGEDDWLVVLGLFTEDEVNHRLFVVHFGTKENSVICVGHYVTKIASTLGYCVDDEIKKCSEPIDCEYWTTKMLAEELDEKNQCLLKETGIPTQAGIGSSEQRQEPRGSKYVSWKKTEEYIKI